MKIAKFAILLLLMGCASSKTYINTAERNYFPIEMEEEATFRYANSDQFVKYNNLNQKREFNGKEYHARLMQYSWGKTDTTFFRSEDESVYYFDRKSGSESIQMPRELKKGVSWTSADNAWSYEITELNANLETPEKAYSGLMVIKATQLQKRDQTKLPEYLNYYEQNVGKIASVTDGKLQTYKEER